MRPEPRRGSKWASDVAVCRDVLAMGSKSFATAARWLPGRMRDAAAVVYAFCRVADDAIDTEPEPAAAHERLVRVLDRAWAGRPIGEPIERALAVLAEQLPMPRAPFDALLEGFAWDAEGRELVELDDVLGYAVRVASSVGVALTIAMGARERSTLARACDLGVAMQLTNIARDVGEDARRGRVYLPTRWLEDAGIARAELVRAPSFSPALGGVVERVLVLADELYGRADAGIAALPADCRPAIRAARLLYADIGRVIRARGCDSIGARAHTSSARRLVLALRARRGAPHDVAHASAPPLGVAQLLVDSAAPS